MLDAILTALVIACLSLVGVIFFGRSGHLTGSHRFVIPVALGVFLGVVFFELIPETLAAAGTAGSIAITVGFFSFYLLSHLLHTFHHHHHNESDDDCISQAGASKLLIGDTVHNLADGVVVASAFLVNPGVGAATAIGVALHEIPQEIAEYGVLRKAGYSNQKALVLNFLSALSIVIGVLLTFLFSSLMAEHLWVLTGIAAGNLLYIATADLIPELNQNRPHSHFAPIFLSTLAGLVSIVVLLTYAHERFGHGHDHHEDDHYPADDHGHVHSDEEFVEHHEAEHHPDGEADHDQE